MEIAEHYINCGACLAALVGGRASPWLLAPCPLPSASH